MAPVDRKYYDLLDIAPEATPDELSSAYKKMALKLHPDKGGSADQFKAMKAAYDVLKDPQKRKLYDSYGPGIVRAMDGEALEPEVMLEILMAASKVASKIMLCALPFVAFLVFFPAVAVSLKWDARVAWNWNVVFIPMWVAQVIALLLVLQLRSVLTQAEDVHAEGEDEADRTNAEMRKRKVKRFFSTGACLVVVLIIQEAVIAGKLEDHIQAVWFLVLVPYVLLEMLWLYMRVYPMLGNVSGLIPTLVPVLWWGILRLITVFLLAAKADQEVRCSYMLCLLPLMIGGGLKVIWAFCQRQPLPTTDEEEPSTGGSAVCGACFTIAAWLSILMLAAGKMDGSTYSAFLVFLPFFLIAANVLCCCMCLACCGPIVLQSFLQESREDQQGAQEAGATGGSEIQRLQQNLIADGREDYSTMSQQSQPQGSPV